MQPYYQDKGITIYHGRCEDVLPQFAAASIDLVFTSPPYNLGMSPSGNKEEGSKFYKPSRSGQGRRFRNGYGVYDDALPWPIYTEWQKSVLSECWRVVDDGGAIFYNHKPRIMHKELWTPLTLNPGLPLRQIIIWDRGGGVGLGDGHFCMSQEWVMLFTKPRFRLDSRSSSAMGDVWRIPYETGDTDHPAPFPIELPGRAINATTAGVILDPHMGTGTTLRAARLLGRRAIGIEIEERWCELAARSFDPQFGEAVVAGGLDYGPLFA